MSSVPPPADDKARLIVAGAAKVFAEKGYHHASMRDIARETGISLAGMYYYFASKEEMLFSIQRWCFDEVLDRLRLRLEGATDPVAQLRVFIHNHVEFFIANVREMKVLSHESESVTGEHRDVIQARKRDYFHALTEILSRLPDAGGSETEVRRNALSIFGMVNWIYTWYDPDRDGAPGELADHMCTLVWLGLRGPRT